MNLPARFNYIQYRALLRPVVSSDISCASPAPAANLYPGIWVAGHRFEPFREMPAVFICTE